MGDRTGCLLFLRLEPQRMLVVGLIEGLQEVSQPPRVGDLRVVTHAP